MRIQLLATLALTGLAAVAQAPAGSAPASKAPATKAPPPAPDAGWTVQFDELWPKRADAKVLKQLYALVEPAVKANESDFEANWRFAAILNWDANNYPNGDLKAGLGKRAWSVADRAIQAKPDDVRAQYNAAVGIGLYSEGVGILTALSQGLEGKFKSRIQAALRIDKGYLDGAPQVVWGRYFFKLPWPKRDVKESIKVLTACMHAHPKNLRARLYLADALLDDGKKPQAKELGEDILSAPVSEDDPAEDNKVKAETKTWLQIHKNDF